MMLNKINKTTKLIIGVSGGVDSVYLLHKLLEVGYNNLIPVHINHLIRKESIKDENFCKQLFKNLKLKGKIIKINIPKLAKNKNLEEVGRKYRYEILEKIRKEEKAKYIVIAHHLDDNIETILLNIFRGSGINGIKGLQHEKGYILRPLLNIKKKEIESECKKKKWKHIVDQSNFDTKYSRNYIRHKVIPTINKISNYKDSNLINLANRAGEISDYLLKQAKEWWGKHKGTNLDLFLSLDIVLQKEILYNLYESKYNNRLNFYEEHINQILDILNKKKTGTKKEFGPLYWIGIAKYKNKRCIKLIKK